VHPSRLRFVVKAGLARTPLSHHNQACKQDKGGIYYLALAATKTVQLLDRSEPCLALVTFWRSLTTAR
jgi:hypothetical protein